MHTILKSKRDLIFLSLFWIVLWVVPWGSLPAIEENIYLAFIIDMARLGIAMGMFIVPGALLYILIDPENENLANWLEILVVGFAFSVLMIALIGLLGRILGMSFLTVRGIYASTGLIELVVLRSYMPDVIRNKWRVAVESLRSDLRTPPLVLAVVLALLMTLNGYLFFYDDTTYLAYITNWQFSDQLGFKNIVFEGDYIESARFWLAMYPMGQALLSNLSGVPGILLLSNYLELFLVPAAVLTLYWFTRMLGLSRQASGFAALIQVSLYCWMIWNLWPVGTWFFQSMSEDKVSAVFLLSPVFFMFVVRFIKHPAKRNLILVLLSGLGLTLTHPVILFFSCSIALTMAVFAWISKQTHWRVLLSLGLVSFICILPYVVIRYLGEPSQSTITYDAEKASETFQVERYIRAINGVFYGLNPELLKFMDIPVESGGYDVFQLFRLIPVFIMMLAGLITVINWKKGALYWYVLTCLLLISLATLPYTGWLLGYAVSARMISRATWFAPLGLSGVLIAQLTVNLLMSRQIIHSNRTVKVSKGLSVSLEAMSLGICVAFVALLLLDSLVSQVPLFFQELSHSRQLAQVGAYIDQSTTHPVTGIALDYEDTQLLPGVSANTVLISFRDETPYNGHNYFLSVEQSQERISESNRIRSLDSIISIEERCSLMEKYDLKFIVAESENAGLYGKIVRQCSLKVSEVFETGNLILLAIK